jgi:hypothetical protein
MEHTLPVYNIDKDKREQHEKGNFFFKKAGKEKEKKFVFRRAGCSPSRAAGFYWSLESREYLCIIENQAFSQSHDLLPSPPPPSPSPVSKLDQGHTGRTKKRDSSRKGGGAWGRSQII